MHAAIAALAAATPSPSPTGPNPDSVTPGLVGFLAMAVVAVVVVLLIWDMMRRIRRGRYRAQVREELDAEQQAEREGDAAVRASDVDDQDIDAGDR